MPLVQTRGAASAQGFGEFAQASVPANYIEEVFSTYLYTGTGAALTITNNIDLSTYGGLTWIKGRSGATGHRLTDTARGATKSLASETTAAEATETTGLTAFGTTGFTIGADADYNTSAATYASWTFRKQAKFFDVVTYTGTGSNTTIAHSLGSVPGSIIVKRTDTTAAWAVYHRSLANTQYLVLNTTAAAATGATWWNSTTPTSTVFSVGTDASVNASGGTYVAYLFAHDAGGFGLSGTDNVISCGSYVGTGAVGNAQTLGYEPQWILIKRNTASYDWTLIDTMRGWATNGADAELYANSTSAEYFADNLIDVTATGFNFSGSATALNASGATYIYIAIRRGPMAVPTLGTSVFSPQVQTPSGAGGYVMAGSSGFPIDWLITKRIADVVNWYQTSRLTNNYMSPNTTAAEAANTYGFDLMQGVSAAWDAFSTVSYAFRRAPSFFDEVCYTGTGSALTVSHNLAAVPELIIGKNRTTAGNNWPVLFNFASTTMNYGFLNLTNSCPNDTYANAGVFSAAPTSTSMFLVSSGSMNTSANNHVAYLFATCAGVSKVFSYTGNGSSQTINCGFTAGARFVLIKRTDSTGDWYVWDSARGIVAGNDPHLSLNTTAAEVTTDDSVDTDNTGFIVNQVAATNVNVSSATYIGLAVA